MSDTFTKEERSEIMSKIRSRGNAATELRFIAILKKHRITGWRRRLVLPGQPDFVFPKQRLAVFIDGDFWHGNPRSFRLPKSNLQYWENKIRGNQRRDRRVSRILRKGGWKVYRFWQSSLGIEEKVVARLRRGLAVTRRERPGA